MTPEFERFEFAARIRRMAPETILSIATDMADRMKLYISPAAIASSLSAWAYSLTPADIVKDD